MKTVIEPCMPGTHGLLLLSAPRVAVASAEINRGVYQLKKNKCRKTW
jgi:hypothetical protein